MSFVLSQTVLSSFAVIGNLPLKTSIFAGKKSQTQKRYVAEKFRPKIAAMSSSGGGDRSTVMVTNDDGIDAPGIRALVHVLVSSNRFNVLVCAPDSYVFLLRIDFSLCNCLIVCYLLGVRAWERERERESSWIITSVWELCRNFSRIITLVCDALCSHYCFLGFIVRTGKMWSWSFWSLGYGFEGWPSPFRLSLDLFLKADGVLRKTRKLQCSQYTHLGCQKLNTPNSIWFACLKKSIEKH